MHVSIDINGTVTAFTAYGASDPRHILNAVAKAFETNIVSEDDPRFWGFNTEEEWGPLRDEIEGAIEDHFYSALLKYLQDEAHDIAPQSIGMQMAQIPKKLVAEDSNLLLPEYKDRLLSAVSKIYEAQTDEEKMATTRTMRKNDDSHLG